MLAANAQSGTRSYVPFRESKLTTLLKQSLTGHGLCLVVACANVLQRFADETLSTLGQANKLESIVSSPAAAAADPKLRLISCQQSQINSLTLELQRAHSQIETLMQLRPAALSEPSTAAKPPLKSARQSPGPTPEVRQLDDTEEEAIREALESAGDKSVLIEKLLNVLRLARQVQFSNSQLREDINQMSSIIEDLNSQVYEKQLEIEELHSSKQVSIFSVLNVIDLFNLII